MLGQLLSFLDLQYQQSLQSKNQSNYGFLYNTTKIIQSCDTIQISILRNFSS